VINNVNTSLALNVAIVLGCTCQSVLSIAKHIAKAPCEQAYVKSGCYDERAEGTGSSQRKESGGAVCEMGKPGVGTAQLVLGAASERRPPPPGALWKYTDLNLQQPHTPQ
jgi:hypothetical protein